MGVEVRHEIALSEAIRQMGQALNLVRVAAHRLAEDENLPGALDITLRALYEINRADDELNRQLKRFREEGRS